MFVGSNDRSPLGNGLRGKVLVVDDHHDGAEALGRLLSALGCEVRLAHSGEEALEVAPSFRPRLIILDIEMPGMDGLETARRLRRRAWTQGCVFASHSGSTDPKIADISREAGFHHHVPKPAKIAAFRRLVEALDDAPGDVDAKPAADPDPGEP